MTFDKQKRKTKIIDDIPKQYPDITKDDVIAAIKFASQFMEHPTKIISEI